MTSLRVWKQLLLLLSVAAGLRTLVSASSHSGPRRAPDCAAGPRLCYDSPVNAGPLINTANFEGGPSLSQDGLTLFFAPPARTASANSTRTSTLPRVRRSPNPLVRLRIWDRQSTRLATGIIRLKSRKTGCACIFHPAGLAGSEVADLYVTTRESTEDPWEPPQNLGSNINTPFFEGQPSISTNGRTLYWDSERPDGLGDFDIWMATQEAAAKPTGQQSTWDQR